MIDFLVMALPRSGTAWLSVFLEATHDPFGKALPETFSGGLVCTGAYLMPAWLETLDCPLAVIERDHRDCDASAKRVGLPPTTQAMRDALARVKAKRWQFASLWQEHHARDLWAYLKTEPFDAARYRRLRELRIEVRDVWKHDASVLNELKRRGLLAL